MQDIYEKRRQDKFQNGRELKKSVPENLTHTKKRTIAKELQDIDDEFERCALIVCNDRLQRQMLRTRGIVHHDVTRWYPDQEAEADYHPVRATSSRHTTVIHSRSSFYLSRK